MKDQEQVITDVTEETDAIQTDADLDVAEEDEGEGMDEDASADTDDADFSDIDEDDANEEEDADEDLDTKLDRYFAEQADDEGDDADEDEDTDQDGTDDAEQEEGVDSENEAETVAADAVQSTDGGEELAMYKRLFGELDKVAKEGLYEDSFQMIADMAGISVDELKHTVQGVSSETSPAQAETEQKPQPVGTQGMIADLLSAKMQADIDAINAKHPDAKIGTIADIKNQAAYVALRNSGLAPADAYAKAVATPKKQDTKKHMVSTSPKSSVGKNTPMTDYERKAAKELFRDMSDREIQELYNTVKNKERN